MTSSHPLASPSRRLWLVATVALIWNLLGVMSYLMTVTMSPQALEALPEAERALYQNLPAWVTGSHAVAVFSGLLGSVMLLLRRAWAQPLFVLSLLAVLLQMGYALFISPLLQVSGAQGAVLPVLVILIAGYLVWYAGFAKARGWLR